MDGLLWCEQNSPGVLNSHCYVISSLCGLVKLWVVGGLSAVISQALSVFQNQWLMCAGLTHPRLPLYNPTSEPGRPGSIIHLKQTGLSLRMKSTYPGPVYSE